MDDLFKGSIASKLAEKVERAADGDAKEGEALLDAMAEEANLEDGVLENVLPGQHLARIRVDHISPAPEGQARQDFNDERLKTLAESLKRSGVREPIIVTPHGAEPGRFQIVAGERRWRAAHLAGLTEIPCIVDPKLVERKDKLLAQAEENLHRENLNPVEEAAILVQLMEARGIDVREAGELIGKGYRQARRLQQLHTAAPPIKRALARGQIDARVAVEMIRVFNRFVREDESPSSAVALRRIESLIERVVRDQWSLKRIEQYAARVAGGGGSEAASEEDARPDHEASDGSGPTASSSGAARLPADESRRGALVGRKDGRLLVDVERLEHGTISPEERASLIVLLEDLLTKTRHAKLAT